VFEQAENRMHTIKAILVALGERRHTARISHDSCEWPAISTETSTSR